MLKTNVVLDMHLITKLAFKAARRDAPRNLRKKDKFITYCSEDVSRLYLRLLGSHYVCTLPVPLRRIDAAEFAHLDISDMRLILRIICNRLWTRPDGVTEIGPEAA